MAWGSVILHRVVRSYSTYLVWLRLWLFRLMQLNQRVLCIIWSESSVHRCRLERNPVLQWNWWWKGVRHKNYMSWIELLPGTRIAWSWLLLLTALQLDIHLNMIAFFSRYWSHSGEHLAMTRHRSTIVLCRLSWAWRGAIRLNIWPWHAIDASLCFADCFEHGGEQIETQLDHICSITPKTATFIRAKEFWVTMWQAWRADFSCKIKIKSQRKAGLTLTWVETKLKCDSDSNISWYSTPHTSISTSSRQHWHLIQHPNLLLNGTSTRTYDRVCDSCCKARQMS